MPGPFLIHPFAGTGKFLALLFVPDLLAEELKIQEPRRNRAATGNPRDIGPGRGGVF